jgi:hypothetical protein
VKDRTVSWAGTLAVAAQQIVVHVHGHAHHGLGIHLTQAQMIFVGLAIVAAPIVAGILLWTRWARAGAILLAVAMPASLAFGVYNHFLVVSPDHVAHLPPGDDQGLFILSAYLLPVTELAGIAVALWALARLRAATPSVLAP